MNEVVLQKKQKKPKKPDHSQSSRIDLGHTWILRGRERLVFSIILFRGYKKKQKKSFLVGGFNPFEKY